MSQEDWPELVARVYVAGDDVEAVKVLGKDTRRGVRENSGWALSEVCTWHLPIGSENERQQSLELLATEFRAYCEANLQADVRCRLDWVELKLTIFTSDSMNANFNLPADILEVVREYDVSLIFEAF